MSVYTALPTGQTAGAALGSLDLRAYGFGVDETGVGARVRQTAAFRFNTMPAASGDIRNPTRSTSWPRG